MKNVLLRNISVISLILISATIYASTDSCTNFFDSNGRVTPGLSELFTATQVQQKSRDICTIQKSPDIHKWCTHPKIERWNLMLPTNLKKQINAIINICENKLGMKKRILPKDVEYAGILFLGANFNNVVKRVNFYNEMLAQGKTDNTLKVWVLTGSRKLDEKAGETKQNFLKIVPAGQPVLPMPANELAMIKFVFHYLMPKEVKVEYVYSPKDPAHGRATTASTAVVWAKEIPRSSRKTYYLAISNQPFVVYQELVINSVLSKMGKKNIQVDVIGDAAQSPKDRENYAAILLDTVAKIIINCNTC